MNAEIYKQVLKKLLMEIPFLSSIELFIWGEPLLNPQLPKILKINNEFGVDSSLSTNLNYVKHLEDAVEAGFSNMLIACSGYGKNNYEITHAGGDWDVFYNKAVQKNNMTESIKCR
jgi:MoaA/NifB/PqqE/SkfB family radical SAM enzyme